MLAFADESIRGPNNLYVIGAIVLAPYRRAWAGDQVRGILLPRQPRFHWRDESDDQRLAMLRRIHDVQAMGVAARTRIKDGNSERARALCLRELLVVLRALGVDEIVFESRQDHNDQRDRRTIIGLQRGKVVREDLSYGFEVPDTEPLLWAADSVAGAVAEGILRGRDSPYEEALRAFLYGLATAT